MIVEEYAMYLRKSRLDLEAEAAGQGDTLARHKRTLVELAKRMGVNIVAIYQEIVSGETIAARPEMQRLLTDVEKGAYSGVLVYEVERLARGDTMDQGLVAQTFKYSGTKILTPQRTYDPNNEADEDYFEFGLFMSRREYRTINRRQNAGRVASSMEGKYVGNKDPYGYTRVKLKGEKGFSLAINEDQASVVRLIFEWYTHGIIREDGTRQRLGASLICAELNRMGVSSPGAGRWMPATIYNLIRNPVYCGRIRWGGRPQVKHMVNGLIVLSRPRISDAATYKGRHEPIISGELFDEVQQRLGQSPLRPVPGKKQVMNPLAGIITCAECGRAMVRRPYKTGYPDTLMCPMSGCPTVSSLLADVEAKLLEGLQEWVQEYQITVTEGAKKRNNTVDTFSRMSETTRRKVEALEGQQSRLYDLLEQGVYTVEVFLNRNAVLTERISRAKEEAAQAAEKAHTEAQRERARRELIPKIMDMLDVYYTLPTAGEKNELLKSVIAKVEYRKMERNPRNHTATTFTLHIYPRIPE